MKINKIKIAIIGFGRFGKLLSNILAPYGDIYIISNKKINNKKIKQIKIKDLENIDITIPAVPISKLKEVLKNISNYLKPGSLIMDVCSVKVLPCNWLKMYIQKDIEILGTHPMFGPDSAKNGLKGLQVVMCPLRISKNKLSLVKNIFKKLNLNIIISTPQNHDKEMAKCLALVHFIGRGLTGINIKKQKISTLGFERLLGVNETVENDTWELFLDMNQYNPYTKKIRKKYLDTLSILNKKINKNK